MTRSLTTDEANTLAAEAISERDLLQWVMGALKLYGWRAVHHWTSIHSAGGFPDICAVRSKNGVTRLLFVELKRSGQDATSEQAAWLADLVCAGAECFVWRPEDWLDESILAIMG